MLILQFLLPMTTDFLHLTVAQRFLRHFVPFRLSALYRFLYTFDKLFLQNTIYLKRGHSPT